MKVILLPQKPFEGSLDALSRQREGVFMPVEQVVRRVAELHGRLVRRGDFNIVVDIDPGSLDVMMPELRGWAAEPVRRTSGTSAFEGVLSYLDRMRK